MSRRVTERPREGKREKPKKEQNQRIKRALQTQREQYNSTQMS